MAWVGKWGTFIHMPKSGGMSMRKALTDAFGGGEEVGLGHGIPDAPLDRPWMLVRHPAWFLRSLWAWREKYGWKVSDDGAPQWANVQKLVDFGRGRPWDEFCALSCATHPGVVGEIYALYALPGIRVFRLEYLQDLYEYLGKSFPVPLENVNSRSRKEGLGLRQIKMIEAAEVEVMSKYYPEVK